MNKKMIFTIISVVSLICGLALGYFTDIFESVSFAPFEQKIEGSTFISKSLLFLGIVTNPIQILSGILQIHAIFSDSKKLMWSKKHNKYELFEEMIRKSPNFH